MGLHTYTFYIINLRQQMNNTNDLILIWIIVGLCLHSHQLLEILHRVTLLALQFLNNQKPSNQTQYINMIEQR
jgi:hypothetical protein